MSNIVTLTHPKSKFTRNFNARIPITDRQTQPTHSKLQGHITYSDVQNLTSETSNTTFIYKLHIHCPIHPSFLASSICSPSSPVRFSFPVRSSSPITRCLVVCAISAIVSPMAFNTPPPASPSSPLVSSFCSLVSSFGTATSKNSSTVSVGFWIISSATPFASSPVPWSPVSATPFASSPVPWSAVSPC